MKKIFLIWLLLFTAALFGNTPYQKGYSAYLAKEYGTAMKYFYISARRHNANAYAKLGIMYEEGLGTSVNTLAAFYWYQKAAQRNHAEAQYRLGHLYEAGAGIQNNQKKAAMWYRRAAKNYAGKSLKSDDNQSSKEESSRSFFDHLKFWNSSDKNDTEEAARE